MTLDRSVGAACAAYFSPMLILANAHTQVRVRRVRKYNTFKAMIQAVGVRKLLPDWDEHTYPKNKLEWAVSTYMNFANGRGTYADLSSCCW